MLLRVKGTFIQVGAPEEPMPAFNAFSLTAKGVKVGGSAIGAPHEIDVGPCFEGTALRSC